MGSPVIFNGARTKLLTSKGLLLQSGHTIDNDGPENYLPYTNFPTSAITGFSPVTISMTGSDPNPTFPNIPTYSAANLTVATTQTSVLGTNPYSLNISSAGAVPAGQGFSTNSFVIPEKQRGKTITINFPYQVISGLANMTLSGTSTNTWGIYLYDQLNLTFIQPAGCFAITQGVGPGFAAAITFQASGLAANNTYRLMILARTATTGAISMNFDDFYLGPQTTSVGPVVTDWAQYIPVFTGFGTVTNRVFWWRRVAGNLEVRGWFTIAGANATIGQVSLPNTVMIDTNAVEQFTSVGNVSPKVGTYGAQGSGNARSLAAVLMAAASSATSVYFGTTAGNITILTPANVNAFAATGEVISMNFEVPIAGWTSNQTLSADVGNSQEVVAIYGLTTTTAIAANGIVKYTAKVKDTTSTAYDPATGLFTAPSPGTYRVSGMTCSSVAGNAAYVRVNGVSGGYLASTPVANYGAGFSMCVPITAAGQTIGIYFDTASNANGSVAQGYQNQVSFERLSGNQQIAASDTVNATYSLTTAQAVGTGATIKYDTRIKDTGGGLFSPATGLFTAPISGIYKISLVVISTTNAGTMYILVNGASVTAGYICNSISTAVSSGSVEVALIAGQSVGIYSPNPVTYSGTSGPGGAANSVVFERVGNL